MVDGCKVNLPFRTSAIARSATTTMIMPARTVSGRVSSVDWGVTVKVEIDVEIEVSVDGCVSVDCSVTVDTTWVCGF